MYEKIQNFSFCFWFVSLEMLLYVKKQKKTFWKFIFEKKHESFSELSSLNRCCQYFWNVSFWSFSLNKMLKSASVIFPFEGNYLFLVNNPLIKNMKYPLKKCFMKGGFISQITGKQSALARAVWRFSMAQEFIMIRHLS